MRFCFGMSLAVMAISVAAFGGVPDSPFVAETHTAHLLDEAKTTEVRAIAVDKTGDVWAGTGDGLYRQTSTTQHWEQVGSDTLSGAVLDICTDSAGIVWIGAWNGLYRASGPEMVKVPGIDWPISALCDTDNGIAAAGPDGLWRVSDGLFGQEPLPCARGVRAILPDADGALWLATNNGLFFYGENSRLYQRSEDILTPDVRGITRTQDGALWAAGLGGVTVYRDGERTTQFGTAEGLPTVSVQCLATAPDGAVWVGTTQGVTRYTGQGWSLRHGRRWLLDDDVRDIAFDEAGTAWVATARGVSAIKRNVMTMAAKAAHYDRISRERHTRAPFIVEGCRLRTPGDVSTWEPEDDDNDGGYTALYVVSESFRYASTKSAEARENARKAFETLELLQTVTGTAGFFARTVVPPTWTRMRDPGDSFTPEEWALFRLEDPRHKIVEKRWLPSSCGQWLWKRDTSSDEATAHFFAYGYYYDLAADEEQKERVRGLVARIMDYIIEGGYVLRDIDGTATRWGVWSPERLNKDPDWATERGINSVEILSYLKTAYHVTGDEKYEREFDRLLDEEGYAENVRRAKTFELAWRTHIDDELLALAYPALLRYEKDPERLALFRESMERWYEGIKNDENPFFEFIHASLTGTPPRGEGIAFLRDAPLDLVNWTMDNSKREDISLVRAREVEPLQTSRMLPASERGVVRWDKNIWAAVQGDGGRTEWAPTFWLLPYWMGRHYGYIDAPGADSADNGDSMDDGDGARP